MIFPIILFVVISPRVFQRLIKDRVIGSASVDIYGGIRARFS